MSKESRKQAKLDNKLIKAVKKGDKVTVTSLLQEGADMNVPSGFFAAPSLIRAVKRNFVDIVKILLENNADINRVDKNGHSALDYAAYFGRFQIAEILLEAGIDRAHWSSAIRHAEERDHPKIKALVNEYLYETKKPKLISDVSKTMLLPPPKVLLEEITLTRPFGKQFLQETFNFKVEERTSVILKTEDGPVEALFREQFDKVASRALEEAFDAYQEQGGLIKREDIASMPRKLKKII